MISNLRPKGRENTLKEYLRFGVNLVYSEGTKTEPYYVDNIKKLIATKYNCRPNGITIISVNEEGKSYHTVNLVQYAKKDVNIRRKNGEKIDHVWIFFDKDDFEDFYKAHRLIINSNNSTDKNAYGCYYDKETGISWHSCWSNEAFELWLVSYLKYDQAKHHRSDHVHYLEERFKSKGIGPYSKSGKNIHDKLIKCGGSLNDAIRNTEKNNSDNKTNNPSSGVVEFIKFFRPYFEN